MTHATDREYWTDADDRLYVPLVLEQERAEDLRYAARAWAHGFAWAAFGVALGVAVEGILAGNDTAVVAGISAIVGLLLPQCDPGAIRGVVSTAVMKVRIRQIESRASSRQP